MQLNKRPFIVVLSFCLFALAQGALAQTTNYITYKIKQGDNLSALAKTYGTTVGDIMRLNGMNSKSVLRIDEEVKIPTKNAAAKIVKPAVTPANPPVQKTTATVTVAPVAITGTPVTHTVAKGESLYRISHMYSVSVDQIKDWNKLPDNNIKLGQVLIVGQQTAGVAVVQKPVAQIPPSPVAVNQPQPPVKESQQAPPVAAPEKQTSVTSNTTTTTVTPPPVIAPQPMVLKDKPVTTSTSANAPESYNAGPDGYFASFYNKSRGSNTLNGDGAAFKTASGWTDKKYYILVNNIEPGTIVRVNANSKTIYAKVLGPLPDIKEDAGLVARISNAAVATLGINDTKFSLTINH